MNEPPLLRPTTRQISGGQSPTRQRVSDDVLQHITPATAVEALSSPTPALKRCLDDAGPAEREFAMRTAMASRAIWEWVDELGEWSWPSGGGSAGFEAPDNSRRKLFTEPDESTSTSYVGSLPAEDVTMYETRIEEIYGEMEGLEVEEIKSHVMTNHIMPLSRPATPIVGLDKSSGYNRMEDLTAVVTAIVMQTLPNIARLSRLLQIWSIRVGVLQQVPSLLRAIEDAEVALRSGWSAITVSAKKVDDDSTQNPEPTLSRNDFGLMKAVIEKKVATPGRTLDYMLDQLEGMSDTLPEDWLDRMEGVERGYAEWVAACERKIGEMEWLKASRSHQPTRSSSPEEQPTVASGPDKQVQKRTSLDPNDNPATRLAPIKTEGFEEPSKESRDARKISKSSEEDLVNRDAHSTPPSSSPTEEMPKLQVSTDDTPLSLDGVYEDNAVPRVQVPTTINEESSPSPDKTQGKPWTAEDEIDNTEDVSAISERDEPELPALPTERRDSNASQESTILHGASSNFGLSSDGPEISASPDLPRTKIREAEYASPSPDASPPSSPPLPQPDTRESFLAPENPADSSINQEDDSTAPKTPMEPDQSFSEYFDDSFSVSELASPSVRRDSTATDQLQQQLSEIIDNIPAKIKLRREPPNLNPPDLQLPARVPKKPTAEPYKRSLSSMSSMSTRTATPSFTLSPAKNSRPRHQRGQQEIKVYHLSRSTGEAPIKLFIRCVGENGERVMVRVGGGWADLSEYLKEYASHHGRRSAGSEKAKVEVRDAPRGFRSSEPRSSPPSRPASALETSPMTPLTVRKTRRSVGAMSSEAPRLKPRPTTPAIPASQNKAEEATESPDDRFTRSRSSSRVSWVEDDSSFLGLAGPSSKKKEMSEENKAWVESVKEKVRIASGERKVSAPQDEYSKKKFGELGKVGSTKRLFRRADVLAQAQQAQAQQQNQGQSSKETNK